MTIDTKSRHRTRAGGNVFLDLGFPAGEAKRLFAHANVQIDESIRLKHQLMDEIAEWMKEASVTQAVAAEVLRVTRPRVSDVINHKVLAKTVTDIEIRSGATVTAGGLLFSALQDGWVVAYDDEKLQELWRFNVGTPLKGAPVVYAIGPKQYLAVQSSGRHLHPVKYDNLEHSSYLFVFAVN